MVSHPGRGLVSCDLIQSRSLILYAFGVATEAAQEMLGD